MKIDITNVLFAIGAVVSAVDFTLACVTFGMESLRPILPLTACLLFLALLWNHSIREGDL